MKFSLYHQLQEYIKSKETKLAEFALPKNSKITKGIDYPLDYESNNTRKVNVYRWSPDDDQNPRLDRYSLDIDDCGPMVLDALIKIKNEIDS